MQNPVPSLPPVDLSVGANPSTGAVPAPSSELVDLFRDKLDAARLAPPDASRSHGPSALTEMVTHEDRAFDELSGRMDRFVHGMQYMSPSEITATTVQLQLELAQMVSKMYAGETVVRGVKSSVQTLMKNQ